MEMNDGDTPSLAYEVLRSQELGRYLVAVRNIEAREIIIREDPLISGPSDRGPKDIPACLGCSRLMVNELTNRCTKCRWPVCNEDCQKVSNVMCVTGREKNHEFFYFCMPHLVCMHVSRHMALLSKEFLFYIIWYFC